MTTNQLNYEKMVIYSSFFSFPLTEHFTVFKSFNKIHLFKCFWKEKHKKLFFLTAIGISLVTNHEIPRKWEVFYKGQKVHHKQQWVLHGIHMGLEKNVFKNTFHVKLISVNVNVKTPRCDPWFLNLFVVHWKKTRKCFPAPECLPSVCVGFVSITAININGI